MREQVDSKAQDMHEDGAASPSAQCDRGTAEVVSLLHRVAVAGGRLAVREFFAPEDFDVRRPSLVLLHGFTGSSASWAATASRLADTFRVLCPDLPGHGDSEFDDIAAACTMEGTVSALAEALTKLSVPAYSLAGYSLGGLVALHCVLEDSTRISTLVLESASPGISDDAERSERKSADDDLAAFIESSPIEAFVDRWEQSPVLASQARLPVAVRTELRESRLACSRAGLAASLRGMGTGVQAWLGGRLRQVHVPTLLVVGRDDEKFRKIAEFLNARIPDSERKIVDGAGHSVHLEAPDALTNEIKAFASPQAATILETNGSGAKER